ncbi:EexN family lipoprotein [Enterobacter bugandensis]|uniref:EexN family lipoprotein n=1 Tax=Enterobacter bugandensis TaxID=881260 RepID=UPI0032AE84B1
MKLKTLTFIVLASVATLTGCEDKTSVEWYTAHHDDMLKKYEECYISHTWEAEDCYHAKTALHREMNKPGVLTAYKAIVEKANKLRQQEPIADLN